MVSISKNSARAGAAAFVLGLSLAGPAIGVAAADSGTDGGSDSVSASDLGPARESRADSSAEGSEGATADQDTADGGLESLSATDAELAEESGDWADQDAADSAVDDGAESVSSDNQEPAEELEVDAATTGSEDTSDDQLPAGSADVSDAATPDPTASVAAPSAGSSQLEARVETQNMGSSSTSPAVQEVVSSSEVQTDGDDPDVDIADVAKLGLGDEQEISPATLGASETALLAGTAISIEPNDTPSGVQAQARAAVHPINTVDAAVTDWFDSIARSLSAASNNPFAEFLQGALLLVRRSLFNHAPTANITQLTSLASGEVVGKINAVDPEGDQVTYKIIEKPSFGTVTIDAASGTYGYTPGPEYRLFALDRGLVLSDIVSCR